METKICKVCGQELKSRGYKGKLYVTRTIEL